REQHVRPSPRRPRQSGPGSAPNCAKWAPSEPSSRPARARPPSWVIRQNPARCPVPTSRPAMLTLVFDDQPWSSTDQPARVATEWRDEHGRAFAVGTVGPHARQITWTGLGTFRFTVDSRDVHFHPVPGIDRAWAADAFTRLIQPLILQAQGLPALHGSATTDADGAVVFCGLSGHGKSTLAYALARRPGFSQLADDAVVLRPAGPTAFVVAPLPFRPRLRPPSAAVLQPPGPDETGKRPSTFHEPPLRA